MKYILAIIGMVIGQLIGGLIADSRAIDWTLGSILGTVGYLFPGFIRYTRSSPKQLLSFHGPDAPISRATSSGELRAFLSQLHKGGLLLDFNPQKSDAKVDGSQWANLNEPEKIALFQILAQAKAVDGDTSGEIKLLSRDGTLLAKYSTTNRTMHPGIPGTVT
jgi:hypothetical protein